MIEQVFSMKTNRKANYFFMSSIIASKGLTVTPGTEVQRQCAYTSLLVALSPDIIPDVKTEQWKNEIGPESYIWA